MRGAKFVQVGDDYDDDCGSYDEHTDSFEVDPWELHPRNFNIGPITESVAGLLFPELVGTSDILLVYCEKGTEEIEAAWRQVLAEHDAENP